MSASTAAGAADRPRALVAAYAGRRRAGGGRAGPPACRRRWDAFSTAPARRPDEIEDLVQEAFFRAFRRLDGWRGEASFRSWLFTIGGNLLRDEHRSGRDGRCVSLDDQDLADSRRSPCRAGGRPRPRNGAPGAGAVCRRLQREVFLLRVQQGAAYDDIAAALGTTPGAAGCTTTTRSSD